MPLTVLLATPRGSNVLRVRYDRAVRQTGLSATSALLSSNYDLTVLTGSAEAPVVEVVEAETAYAVLVRTDRRLLARATYRVVVAISVEALDGTLMAPPANQADFPGIVEPLPRVLAKRTDVRRNVDVRYDTITGMFGFSSDGDLDAHEGAEAVRKRVVRRLMSAPGGFRHLDDYGAGLRVKEPFRSTDLAETRVRVLDQVREERDLRLQAVDVEMTAGVLYVRVRGRVGGEPISIEVPTS